MTITWSFSVSCQSEANRKVRYIESFARLYGYARWFHPSDEAQEIDWDKFAVLGIQKVENIKSTSALRDTLFNLFSPIVQGLQIYKSGKSEEWNPSVLSSPDVDAQPVAWQHNGVYFGKTTFGMYNVYRSARTNVKRDNNISGSFVGKTFTNLSHLKGKDVKFSGYFKRKSANDKGIVKLYLYPSLFINELEKSHYEVIIDSQEWEKHELLLTIPEESSLLIYGFIVEGDCEVWADDFELLTNNRGIWELVDTLNMGFELGKESIKRFDDWQLNMERHIYEISEDTPYSGKYCLKVSPIDKLFDRMPQFGEVIREEIGNNLACVVPLTLHTNDTTTYPKTKLSVLQRLKSDLGLIEYGSGFNQQVNLASVVITWNVLQHFFPYFEVLDVECEKLLGKTLKSTLSNKRESDFYVTLSKMISKINDGHGAVFGQQMYHLPIRTELIENQIVITSSIIHQLEKGDIIKKMDGKSVLKVLKETEEMVSGSPQLRRYRALNILGSKLSYIKTSLVIQRGNKRQKLTVPNTRSRFKGLSFNIINEGKYLLERIVEIEPGIFYINMHNCTENEFDQKIEVLANAKAVIYDNRGVSRLTFFHIVPHLINEPVISAWWNIPQTIYPNRKEVEFQKSNWNIQPKHPFFKSKSVIINDPSVVSSGETMMGIIDHYQLATTVGEPTAGCNGNVNQIDLPCGYIVMWTGMKVTKHDGSQLFLKGFQPDYPVNKTIQAVMAGRDEYLEKALEIANLRQLDL